MADLNTFLKRLDEQVEKARKGVEQKQTELQQTYEGRKQRYQTFLRLMDDLRGVARPRLEKLAEALQVRRDPDRRCRRQERSAQIQDAGGTSPAAAFGHSRHRSPQSCAGL